MWPGVVPVGEPAIFLGNQPTTTTTTQVWNKPPSASTVAIFAIAAGGAGASGAKRQSGGARGGNGGNGGNYVFAVWPALAVPSTLLIRVPGATDFTVGVGSGSSAAEIGRAHV